MILFSDLGLSWAFLEHVLTLPLTTQCVVPALSLIFRFISVRCIGTSDYHRRRWRRRAPRHASSTTPNRHTRARATLAVRGSRPQRCHRKRTVTNINLPFFLCAACQNGLDHRRRSGTVIVRSWSIFPLLLRFLKVCNNS